MFNKEVLTPEEAAMIVQNARLIDRASIADQLAQRPFSVQIQTLDLSTAQLETNPYEIKSSFKSIYIQDATDVNVSINVKLGSRDSVQAAFAMKKNDSVSNDIPVTGAFLHWSAQSGKTITLVVFTDAKFESGSQISVSGGGVSINDGTAVSAATTTTLVAATAAIIAPASSTRKVTYIENATGAPIYFAGTSAVAASGANRGIKLEDGEKYEYRNTAALYAISTPGGAVVRVDLT